MPDFKIEARNGWMTIVNDVYMSTEGSWTVFSALTLGSTEVLRVNSAEMLYIARIDMKADDV